MQHPGCHDEGDCFEFSLAHGTGWGTKALLRRGSFGGGLRRRDGLARTLTHPALTGRRNFSTCAGFRRASVGLYCGRLVATDHGSSTKKERRSPGALSNSTNPKNLVTACTEGPQRGRNVPDPWSACWCRRWNYRWPARSRWSSKQAKRARARKGHDNLPHFESPKST